MRLQRLREPFDHPDWLFEVKHDGFRGLAYIESGTARLVSRKRRRRGFPGREDGATLSELAKHGDRPHGSLNSRRARPDGVY